MSNSSPFTWRHFEGEIILLCVRCYLRYALSYRDLEEMMGERGLAVDHTTVFRWVQRYAPELERRCRPYLTTTNDSYRVDETYIKVKGQRKYLYLYRAVDSQGNTIDFLLCAERDSQAAERFFRKVLKASHTAAPRVINVDGNPAYPSAFDVLRDEGVLPEACSLRSCKYLNSIVEQDQGFIKRLVKPGLGFSFFHTAWRTLRGYEVMNMICRGQLRGAERGNIVSQNRHIAQAFGLA